MTDDELLALARAVNEARNIQQGAAASAAFHQAANPDAIIALIERHRAEVERLTRERDGARQWNRLYDRNPNETQKKAIALRAANWEMGCACQFDENDDQIIWCSAHVELRQRAESAESALAAAQKRIAELLQDIVDCGKWTGNVSNPGEYMLDRSAFDRLRKAARVTLAGKQCEEDGT